MSSPVASLRYYFDYKSPYAWLAQDGAWALADEPGVDVEFLPYTLQIPKYLGEARLDADGHDTVGTRNDHQWRRVRYAYMDCRREANRRGLTIRGPRKIFDSTLSHTAFLFLRARHAPVELRPFHDGVFERFWRRELDIEDRGALEAVMRETGFDPAGFADFAAGEGAAQLARVLAEAEEAGVFGVPSYLVDDELFWGHERLGRARERLGLAPSPA